MRIDQNYKLDNFTFSQRYKLLSNAMELVFIRNWSSAAWSLCFIEPIEP